MNDFGRFMEAVSGLAAASPRQDVTAPTADQVAIAAGILRLAEEAEAAREKIVNRQMTRDEWNSMADAYKSVADLAAIQGLEAPVIEAADGSEIEGQSDAGS